VSVVGAFLAAAGAVAVVQTVHAGGAVRAWGYNIYGQCNVPGDLGACAEIAAGALHTVALRQDGAVRAWGYNGYGQCNVPSELGACSAIAAGVYHTVAIRQDGAVRAW
jgi:alpha-tubulin suppressor-like RCC1 family protein